MNPVQTIYLPADEELRLSDLLYYEILDTPPEKEYDDLMELAAKICGCPIASITFVDSDRQWFKASKGFAVTETSRDIAFCAHTILQHDVMMIKDPENDERFADNTEINGGVKVKFYAGAPIVSMAGHNLGAICVIDKEKRTISEDQKSVLILIAGQISKLLELRVKNKILRNHAEKLLNAEKLTVDYTLREQEKERQFFQHELLENFAQVLSALTMKVEMAVSLPDKRVALLQKTKLELRQLLKDIYDLSDTISPVLLNDMETGLLLPGFIKQLSKKSSVNVDFKYSGNLEQLKNNSVLAISRIIQLNIELIKNSTSITVTNIELFINKNITIEISNPVFSTGEFAVNHEILFNSILRRAEMYLGSNEEVSCKKNNGKIVISLPLNQ